MPTDDEERLQVLRSLLILDTPPEQRFDRIVAFAAAEFDVPIALLTLVDHNRQWFKARVGLDVCSTARDVSFCGHVVHAREVMVIEDALADDRFADNPLVTAAPNVRFYAGAPLIVSGRYALGTLCLIDHRPRTIDRVGLAILHTLRDLAVAELSS